MARVVASARQHGTTAGLVDRRRCLRRVLSASDEVISLDLEGGNEAFLTDICVDGIGVQTAAPLHSRHFSRLILLLPQASPIIASGQVVWIVGTRVGLRLVRYEGESRRELAEWMNPQLRELRLRQRNLASVAAGDRKAREAEAEENLRLKQLVLRALLGILAVLVLYDLTLVPWRKLILGPEAVSTVVGTSEAGKAGSTQPGIYLSPPEPAPSPPAEVVHRRGAPASQHIRVRVPPPAAGDRDRVLTGHGLESVVPANNAGVYIDVASGADPTRANGRDQASRAGGTVNRVMPVYPAIARQKNIAGDVRLAVLVAPDGSVERVTASSGHPLLAAAAIEAVRQWRYHPMPPNRRQTVVTYVTFQFSIEGR